MPPPLWRCGPHGSVRFSSRLAFQGAAVLAVTIQSRSFSDPAVTERGDSSFLLLLIS